MVKLLTTTTTIVWAAFLLGSGLYLHAGSVVDGQAVTPTVAEFVGSCSRICGTYESCFVYENVEHCAPFCGPGRCNDTSERCVIQGRACSEQPCLPIVQCEPKYSLPQLPQGVTVASELPAVGSNCARQCPMISAPVCASNGVSYANQCFFEQAQCLSPSLSLSIVATQLCEGDHLLNAQYNPTRTSQLPPATTTATALCDAIICSTVEDPVCTTSGTMRNLCFWKKAQCTAAAAVAGGTGGSIALLSRTACDASAFLASCPVTCTQEFIPVCASNGVLYGNECLFRQAKCLRKPFGELLARDVSECELQVGDSQGMASSDIAAMLLASV